MKLINLGFLFSALTATETSRFIDLSDKNGNYTINASCSGVWDSYGHSDKVPVKGRKYRIGTVKICGSRVYFGLLHWKNYHHGWPDSIFGTWSWGVAQDTECNASNKAFVRIKDNGDMYDDERDKRYAYMDTVDRPWQSGSAICTLVNCKNDFEFIDANHRFSTGNSNVIYHGFKWHKKSAASSRAYFDLRCSGDDIYSTGDIEESFFVLMY